MEDLKVEELNILLQNNTKEELAEQLMFYKHLERQGNIYHIKLPHNHHSVVQLLKMATLYSDDQLKEMLDFSFMKNDRTQSRSITKYNKHRNFLNLSKSLANQYYHEYKCCSPRIKGNISTDQILDFRSNVKNVYPYKYIDVVKIFLKNYPIEKWHINKSSICTSNDKHFTLKIIENQEKFECNYCEICLIKSSRKRHLKCCKKFQKSKE